MKKTETPFSDYSNISSSTIWDFHESSKLANLLIEIGDSVNSSSLLGSEIMEEVEFNLMVKTSCQPVKIS